MQRLAGVSLAVKRQLDEAAYAAVMQLYASTFEALSRSNSAEFMCLWLSDHSSKPERGTDSLSSSIRQVFPIEKSAC